MEKRKTERCICMTNKNERCKRKFTSLFSNMCSQHTILAEKDLSKILKPESGEGTKGGIIPEYHDHPNQGNVRWGR